MAVAEGAIVVENLAEFRAAVRKATGETPKLISAGIKRAGVPVVVLAAARAPKRTGRLASGYRVSVRGVVGSVVSSVPYAGGAEWGRRGKWKGFAGAPPRIAAPAVETAAPEIERIVFEGLRSAVTIYGFAT